MQDKLIFDDGAGPATGQATVRLLPLFDPLGVIHESFACGIPHDCARAVLFRWMMDLPDSVDPARAAQACLSWIGAAPRRGDDRDELVELLQQVAQYPRDESEAINARRTRRRRRIR